MHSLTSDSSRIAILTPTRNRPELAIQTIQSVLKQGHTGFKVIASDNSTRADAAKVLSKFSEAQRGTSLTYIRPSQPLPMAEHWQWALEQVLNDASISHVVVATDRMAFYHGALEGLAAIVSKHPRSVITFNCDSIADIELPCRLSRKTWTGQLYRIPSQRFLTHSARMRGLYLVPKLMNCVVPRDILEKVANRFGNFCVSLSPDYAFAYRFFAIEDEVYLYDRSLVVHHAFAKSNGTSLSRGVLSADSRDFVAAQGGSVRLIATPVPDVLVGTNAMIHEYCLVKEQDAFGRFPDLDLPSYFENLFDQVEVMENPEVRAHFMSILRTEELRLLGKNSERISEARKNKGPDTRSIARRTTDVFKDMLKCGPSKPFWFALADRFNVKPPNYIDFDFPTVEKAMEFANRFPLPQLRRADHLTWLIGENDIDDKELVAAR